MNISEALELIYTDLLQSDRPQTWADLGCGSGLFTRSLASLLPPGSVVYGIDRLSHSLGQVRGKEVDIRFIKADFQKDDLNLPGLDGILMANSLHFIKEKQRLVAKLKTYLNKDGKLLIIEYDTSTANPWIPYPVNYFQLVEIFRKSGFRKIKKLAERKSRFGRKNLYSCLIEKNISA